MTPMERFLAKVRVDATSGCWVWIGAMFRSGYGNFYLPTSEGKPRNMSAHRASLILHGTEVPTDLTVDHLCKNPSCVNPEHLEVVTQWENNRRGDGWSGKHLRQDECIHGHPFTPENTIIKPATATRRKRRQCRACTQLNQRRYDAARPRRVAS